MKKTSATPPPASTSHLVQPPGALPVVEENQRLITEQTEFLEPLEWEHRPALEEVKRRVGITHRFYDAWVYKFLENKNFDIDETVAKLERRTQMERTDLMTYEVTDEMRNTMRSGVMQLIGTDREGRVTFYVVTSRDFPKAEIRKMRTQNFDMWMSYGCRIRPIDAKCRICLLINQKDAGVWANTDMTFQSNIALRIAKFYPGVVDRAYVCNMGRALSAVARPVISAFPKVISERIFIYSESDVKKGKLLELFDADVLPIGLGGRNDCDHPPNYQLFCETIERYFAGMKAALQAGKSVKEWELETALSECRQVERARAQAAQDAADEEEDAAMEKQREQQRQRRVSHVSRRPQHSPGPGSRSAASDRGISNAPDSIDVGMANEADASGSHAAAVRGQSTFTAPEARSEPRTGRSGSPLAPMLVGSSGGLVIGGVVNVRQPRVGATGDVDADFAESDFDEDDDLETAVSESGHDFDDAMSETRQSKLRRGTSFSSVCSRLSSTYNGNNNSQRLGIAGFDALLDRPLYSNDRPLVSSLSTRRARYYVGPASVTDSGMVTARTPRQLSALSTDSISKLKAQETFFRRMFERWQQEQTDFLRGQLTRVLRSADGDALAGTMAGAADERWIIHSLPPHLRAAAYWVVAWVCAWVSIFFFLAAIFVQLQIGSLIVIMWATLFNSPYLIFPLGFGILVLGIQGVLYGARGFELSRSLMRGNLAPPLRGLGHWSVQIQCILTLSVVIIQFVTFAVYASTKDPIMGLQIGFSTGLYACAILILAYHILFPLGVGGVDEDLSGTLASAADTRRSNLGLQLYLFFNVTEGSEDRKPARAGEARSIPVSAAIIAVLPVVFSFVFGICVMLDFSLVWVVLFVISEACAVASVNHFFAERVNTLSSNLTRVCAWLVGLLWLFICFAVALIPMTSAWKAALAVPGCILTVMCVVAYATHHLPEGSVSHRLCLRIAYCLLGAGTIAAIGVLFSIQWILGLFGIILTAHSLLCRIRPNAVPGPGSVFTQIVIMELILLAVVLFAISFRQPSTVSTMLKPVGSTPAPAVSSRDQWLGFIDTPTVCSLAYPLYVPTGAAARYLNVKDFALISALSYGLNGTQIVQDVGLALPGWEFQERMTAQGAVQVDRYSDANNNTIFAVRYAPGNLQAIQGVAQWTEAIGLLPYAVLMPTEWTSSVVSGLTKVSSLMDSESLDEADDAVETIGAFRDALLGNANSTVYPHIFLTGHSVAGGIASVIGSRLGILAVTFSAPGLLYTGPKFDVSSSEYERFVTSIRSTNDALGYIDKHGPNTQEIGCGGDTAQCSEVKTTVCKLHTMCGAANGYTVTNCDL